MIDEESTGKTEGVDSSKPSDEKVAESPKLSVDDVAKEVIAGMWGRGQMRKKRLTEAGYDPVEVKAAVDKIFGRV